ncbi:MAG: hypothetical protein JST92_07830 [Deltaproteobacteria bacterium]|nr:hypothetical protein [Deltaproteobacteria bacterium]
MILARRTPESPLFLVAPAVTLLLAAPFELLLLRGIPSASEAALLAPFVLGCLVAPAWFWVWFNRAHRDRCSTEERLWVRVSMAGAIGACALGCWASLGFFALPCLVDFALTCVLWRSFESAA